MTLAIDSMTQLRPTTVLRVAGTRVQLDLPDEQPWAQLALAYPYRPDAGDVVLAIGQERQWYVIGVLKGQGLTELTVPGDLRLSAPQGSIELNAGRGIRLRGPVVQVLAQKLHVAARSVVERFGRVARSVQRAYHLAAGRMHTRVEGSYRVDAGRIVEKAEGDVNLDGKKIHLG